TLATSSPLGGGDRPPDDSPRRGRSSSVAAVRDGDASPPEPCPRRHAVSSCSHEGTREETMDQGPSPAAAHVRDAFTYRGERARTISFPLGGIGTGSIGLSGAGRLIDWEIFNKPSKGSVNLNSHFAVKAMDGDRLLDARILNGPVADRFA